MPALMESMDEDFFKAVGAEFLATLLFLFITISTAVNGCVTTDNRVPALKSEPLTDCTLDSGRMLNIALSFGISIFVLVYAAAAYSGGHINPAVTLGLLLANKISVVRALFYMVAQVLGGLVGVAIVKQYNPVSYAAAGGAANQLFAPTTPAGGWGMETILTFCLVWMVLSATDSERAVDAPHLPILAPLAIGLTVFLAHIVAIPVTNCCINPARGFAAAAVSGNWDSQWIWWVGPFSGAILAVLVYEIAFRPDFDGIRHRGPGVGLFPGMAGVEGEEKTGAAGDVLPPNALTGSHL
ncbi:hypothetical protein WJX81_003428 [Elliptochloris bilobata]|uniref:Aquaporin n=1 Tax=Elliptochloris bilobata TaxID=381761 RepID=A0AAW1RQ71_9CHLO